MSGFYLGFEIWGGGGGEAIVDNVDVGGWMWEEVFPPARSAKTEAFYDLTELNFNSCVISAGKSKSYNIICTITGKPFGGGGGSWAVGGGKASPLPPPVDRTLCVSYSPLYYYTYTSVHMNSPGFVLMNLLTADRAS